MIGVYRITSPSGRIYIGQSWDINKRRKHYLHKLESQRLLHNSVTKYGWSQHTFEVIHTVSTCTQEQLDYLETFFWRSEILKGSKMLNLKEPGSRGRHSEETKKILSDKFKGDKNPNYGKDMSGSNNPSYGYKKTSEQIGNFVNAISKPIIQYSLKGEPIKEWESAKAAERSLRIPQANISEACRNKRKTAGGFIWTFKNI